MIHFGPSSFLGGKGSSKFMGYPGRFLKLGETIIFGKNKTGYDFFLEKIGGPGFIFSKRVLKKTFSCKKKG